jgi:HAD superfamily hydrolase (TIGR01509 family)
MSQEECAARFIGKTVRSEKALIEERTGQPWSEDWLQAFYARRNAQLELRLQAVPHIHDAVAQVHQALNGRMACASGADKPKVEMQLRKVGLHDYFAGRIFSGHDLPRSKPHPDVYLAAAKALNVAPERCAVVEDTVTGVQAGVAAGACVFGFVMLSEGQGLDESGTAKALLQNGATRLFSDMRELQGLLLG